MTRVQSTRVAGEGIGGGKDKNIRQGKAEQLADRAEELEMS